MRQKEPVVESASSIHRLCFGVTTSTHSSATGGQALRWRMGDGKHLLPKPFIHLTRVLESSSVYLPLTLCSVVCEALADAGSPVPSRQGSGVSCSVALGATLPPLHFVCLHILAISSLFTQDT